MEFKEWLLESERNFDEECELIREFGLDENILTTPFKFAAGAGGNFLSQNARGLGNAVKGIFRTGLGTGQAALAAAQRLGGGRKAAGETFSKAKKNVAGGLGNIARGAAQVGASLVPISPVLRGAQAASEPLGINGVYAPNGKDRTWTQDLLGLNSWDDDKKPSGEVAPSEVAPSKPEEDSAKNDSDGSATAQVSKKRRQNPELEALIAAYRAATSSSEPKFWAFREGRIKGPYTIRAIYSGYKKGKLAKTDLFSDSESGPWEEWSSFGTFLKTMLSKSRSSPKEILATIAMRYPKYYEAQVERSRSKKSARG